MPHSNFSQIENTNKCYKGKFWTKTLIKQDQVTQQYSCKLTGLYQKTYLIKRKQNQTRK